MRGDVQMTLAASAIWTLCRQTAPRACSTVGVMQRLAGRSVVVTGAASGLGRAMALAFAAEGARVVVGDVRRDPLHVGGVPTDELIADAGGAARFVQADVSRAADFDRLVEAALALGGGRLDVMVNNAMVAGPHSKGLLETSEDDWDVILDVGLRGTFLGCRSAVRQMLAQEPYGEVRGRVINMASSTAWSVRPDTSRIAP
jgi:glucose 1-dehydrogenase